MDGGLLDRLIDAEQRRFARLRPKSAELWRRGQDHFIYGAPSHWMRRWAGGFPVYVAEARGAHVVDVDGHRYADFCLGDTGGMCGHGVAAVTGAVAAQLPRGAAHMSPTEDSPWVGAELARRFGLPYWSLTTSATDANRAALRIARMITGRAKVLVFSGCYHGGVEEAHIELRDGKVAMRNMIHPNAIDHSGIAKVIEFNDIPALEAALKGGDVAAVLTEPFMTNFGMIPAADGFHAALRDLTRRAGAMLIIDETHTLSCGVGGYTRLHGLEPDLFTAGKAIAGGIPAGVFGLSQETAERLWRLVPKVNPRERQSAHLGMGGTLAGNALTVAAMRAVLEHVLTEENYARMFETAAALAADIRSVIAAHDLPWHATEAGARVELMFMPSPPRNGADVIAGRNGPLETLFHAFFLNEGVMLTPFHAMFLMCPETTLDDVAVHGAAMRKFVALLEKNGLTGRG